MNRITHLLSWGRKALLLLTATWICNAGFANETIFKEARTLQHEGKHNEAIETFKTYLMQPIAEEDLADKRLFLYTEALVQLMNTYQSKGEPEACIQALQEVFKGSPILQKQCLRDYYSVMGYALSRTERMKEAEEAMLKVFTLPLYKETPERYFRDYAYAAAVFYGNPNYQKEVVYWCQEALRQAELCKNTSGKQWVMAMLGSHYKRNGLLNKALELYQKSKEEALHRNDELGALNSLQTLIDLFLYWDVPEYANLYASEAIRLEKDMTIKNPMVSAQAYINKGRALLRLGETDSASYYTELAQEICQPLPYNSGMVDVDLLYGTLMTEKGEEYASEGIQKLQRVIHQGTDINRAKAYHQLAQTYLKSKEYSTAEAMLDSMCALLNQNGALSYIHIDYEPILNHYLKAKNQQQVELFTRMMLREEQAFKEKKLKFNLTEAIVELQTEQERQELKIMQLKKTNQRLWFLICMTISASAIALITMLLVHQKKQHRIQMGKAEEKLNALTQKLNQSNAEKEVRAQEIKEFLSDRDNREELETLTPTILQTDGETKFKQYFELLYPLFLPRLREKVPSITNREELLSMLIVLKQDNKRIAELLAIAPRSVLMLRHRFRQKIGLNTELSLESFIEEVLNH